MNMQNVGLVPLAPGGSYLGGTFHGATQPQSGSPIAGHFMGGYFQQVGAPLHQIGPMGVPVMMGSHMAAPMSPVGVSIGQTTPSSMAPPQVGAPIGSSGQLAAQLGPGRNSSGAGPQIQAQQGATTFDNFLVASTFGQQVAKPVDGMQSLGSGQDVNLYAAPPPLEQRGRAPAADDVAGRAGTGQNALSQYQQTSDPRDAASVRVGSRNAAAGATASASIGRQAGESSEVAFREPVFNQMSTSPQRRLLIRDPRTGAFVPSAEVDPNPSPPSGSRQPSNAPPLQRESGRPTPPTNRACSVHDRRHSKQQSDGSEVSSVRQAPEVLREARPEVLKETPKTTAPKKKYVRPHLPNTVPTKDGVEHLEPEEVFAMLQGEDPAVLVDVRGSDRSAGLIDGAVHVPAVDKVMFPTRVPDLIKCFAGESLVIFTCQYSAHRAPQCANWYREKAPHHQRVAILAGGFRAWEANGFPVAMQASMKDEDKAADAFAMKQGVAFVKKHAPEVYQRAKQQQPQQEEQQQQPQNQQLEQAQSEEQCAKPPQMSKSEKNSEKGKAAHDTKSAEKSAQQFSKAQQKSRQQRQTLQLQQQQLRQQLEQLQQQHQRQLERQQQQLLQQQRLQHHLQQQAQELQAERPSTSSTDSGVPHRHPSQTSRGIATNTVPVIEGVEILDPVDVYTLLYNDGCVLVDVRGDDRAAGLIAGAYHVPAIGEPMFPTRLPDLLRAFAQESLVVFTCQYCAHRGPQCANWYREQANPMQRVAVLAGGFRGWEASGLPVASPAANPNEAIMSSPTHPSDRVPADGQTASQTR